MSDAKIIYAIQTLNIDFLKEPTEQKAWHIGEFIDGSVDDLTDHETILKLTRYCDAMNAACNFNFRSLTKVERIAAEIWG